MQMNGHAPRSLWDRLTGRSTPRADLAEALARAERAERAAERVEAIRIRESLYAGGWLDYYADIVSRMTRGDGWMYGPNAGHQDRRYGRNWPLYQTEQELGYLRQASRILVGRSPNADGLLNGLAGYVLGCGLTYRVQPKKNADQEQAKRVAQAAQQIVDHHLKENAYQGGEKPALEREFFRRSRRDGEAILLHFPQEDGTIRDRFAEPDQLRQPPASSMDEWSFGIRNETDPIDTEEPLGYWISHDPGNNAAGKEYPPELVTHYRANVDRNVKRGCPDFAFDAYSDLDLATKLRSNMGEAAAQQAAIVFLRQWESGTQANATSFVDGRPTSYQQTDPLTGSVETVFRAKKGEHQDIPKAMTYVEPPGAAAAPNHLQILAELYRAAGRKWNAPEWLTSGDASNGNYACHDSRTELLTKRGWLRYDELAYGDVAGTMNPETGEFEWQAIEAIHVHDYDGEMIRLSGAHNLDLMVTPNHRMYTARCKSQRPGGRKGKIKRIGITPFQFIRAGELRPGDILPLACRPKRGVPVECFTIPATRHRRKYLSPLSHPQPRQVAMRPFLRYLGWWVSEGWTAYSGQGHTIGISQSKKNAAECQDIRAMAALVAPAVREFSGNSEMITWQTHDKSLWTWLRENCGTGSYSKRLPEFINDLPAVQQGELLDALILGDGTEHKSGSRCYFSVSRRLTDQVQSVAIQNGYVSHLQKPMRNGVIPVSVKSVRRRAMLTAKQISRVPYRGVVWCATVPNGLLVTRRNGKAIVTGNSSLVAESPFVLRIKAEQPGYCETLSRGPKLALQHWCEVNGLRVDGKRLGWDEVNELVELLVTAPDPQSRNRLEEAQRAQILIPLGVTSRQKEAARQGEEWEDIERDNAEYDAAHPQDGFGLGAPGLQAAEDGGADAGGMDADAGDADGSGGGDAGPAGAAAPDEFSFGESVEDAVGNLHDDLGRFAAKHKAEITGTEHYRAARAADDAVRAKRSRRKDARREVRMALRQQLADVAARAAPDVAAALINKSWHLMTPDEKRAYALFRLGESFTEVTDKAGKTHGDDGKFSATSGHAKAKFRPGLNMQTNVRGPVLKKIRRKDGTEITHADMTKASETLSGKHGLMADAHPEDRAALERRLFTPNERPKPDAKPKTEYLTDTYGVSSGAVRHSDARKEHDQREADDRSHKWLTWDGIKQIPAQLLDGFREQVKKNYAKLEERYGPTWAKTIVAAGVAALPIPVPGASFAAAAPFVAMAELHKRLSGPPEAPAGGLPADLHPDIPVRIRGKTFQHLETLRKMAHFDRADNAWVTTQDNARKLKAMNLPGVTYGVSKSDIDFYHGTYGEWKKNADAAAAAAKKPKAEGMTDDDGPIPAGEWLIEDDAGQYSGQYPDLSSDDVERLAHEFIIDLVQTLPDEDTDDGDEDEGQGEGGGEDGDDGPQPQGKGGMQVKEALTETVDKNQAKHDDDGKFSATSGHAKAKVKGPGRKKAAPADPAAQQSAAEKIVAAAANQTPVETQIRPDADAPTVGEIAGVKAKPQRTPEEDAADDYAKNGTRSKAFKAWFGDWEADPENSSKVVNEKGEPQETYEIGSQPAPKVVYHGTGQGGFDQFEKGKNSVMPLYGPGFYFTDNESIAKEYSQTGGNSHVFAVHLNIREPFDLDAKPTPEVTEKIAAGLEQLKSAEPKKRYEVKVNRSIDAAVKSLRDGTMTAESGIDLLRQLSDTNIGIDHEQMVYKNVTESAFQDVLKSAGYDGLTHVGGKIMGGGREHRVWIAFEPNQIKSTDNRGTFDPNSPKLREGR